MTPEQIDALPTERRRRRATADDAKRHPGALWIEWMEDRPVRPDEYKLGEPLFYLDTAGNPWTVHAWDNGEKFKRRFFAI